MSDFYTFPLILVLVLGALAAVVIGDQVSKRVSRESGTLIVGPVVTGATVAVVILAAPLLVTLFMDVILPQAFK